MPTSVETLVEAGGGVFSDLLYVRVRDGHRRAPDVNSVKGAGHDAFAEARANLGTRLHLAQEQKFPDTSRSLRQEKPDLTQAADVMQGTLDLLILKALSRDPMHGWGISNRIRLLSRDAFQIGQGSLYPALHRFETRAWVTSYWRTTENNRIARYYELTIAGRHALAEEVARWRSYTSAMELVIEARQ